jgi:hypothetical protein
MTLTWTYFPARLEHRRLEVGTLLDRHARVVFLHCRPTQKIRGRSEDFRAREADGNPSPILLFALNFRPEGFHVFYTFKPRRNAEMIESDRNDDAANDDSVSESEGGVGNYTPQAEVSGDDPAGFEVSGAGDEGGVSEPSGGVGDWDPASQGGGGGELY